MKRLRVIAPLFFGGGVLCFCLFFPFYFHHEHDSVQYMNAYERGFVDGLREAYRLMQANYEIDFSPGVILDRIKQLSGDEGTSSDPLPPDDRTCHTDP